MSVSFPLRMAVVVAAGLWAGLSAFAPVRAQQTPPPAGIDAGRIPQQFNIPATPAAPVPLGSIELPDGPRPANAQTVPLNLTAIAFEGASVYDQAQLSALAAGLIGRPTTLSDLFDLADAITAKYRAGGYVLSRAVVPSQRIEGVARIAIVEGYIDRVAFDGPATAAMRRYADSLTEARPLTIGVLERYLLLMNDLPGYQAKAVFTPSPSAPGGSDLTVAVTRKPLDAFIGLDNRGTRYIGPVQAYAGAGYAGLFGLGDKTSIQYVTTPGMARELRYGQIAQEFALGSEGTKLTASVSRSVAHPGFTLRAFDAGSFGTTAQAGVSHPWLRGRTTNLYVNGAFVVRDSTTILNQDRTSINSSDDRTRALRIGVNGNWQDAAAGYSLASVDFYRGLDAFGASRTARLKGTNQPPPSRDGGRSDFSKVAFEATRLQGLPWVLPGLSVLTGASGQWAFNQAMLASEQFGVGGGQFGRGYDSSEITGDYGWAAKLELQYLQPFELPMLSSIQYYTFYDAGQVAQQRRGTLTKGKQSLASTGIGARVTLTPEYSANFEIAKPLTRRVATEIDDGNAKAARFFFGLTARY